MVKKGLVYIPLFVIPVLDQVSKINIPYFLKMKSLGGVQFYYHLNQNFILGSFEHVPLFTKSVVSCSIFLILFSLVIYFQLLLIPSVTLFRLSLNSYFASMLSNCIDKMLYLGVRDFILVKNDIVFNVADSFQWIALPLLIYSVFKYSKELWRPDCLRKSYFTGAKSQLKITCNFSVIILTNLFFMAFFSYSFLNYIGLSNDGRIKFLVSSMIFITALSFASIVFVLVYSQRIVGPVASLLAHIKKNKTAESNYKMRKGDPLVELEEIALLMRKEENDY